MLVYNWYANKYGWSPDIVDTLSLDQIIWFPVIAEALDGAAEIVQKEQEAQGRSNRW